MRDEFLVFGKPLIGQAEIDEITDTLRNAWVGTGPKVRRFEQQLEEYVGTPHVRCLSSCTAALMLAIKVLGIKPGDEVIVPSMTFVASANAVELAGATPVLIDSEPRTGLLDMDALEDAIRPGTTAILPVHLAGRPLDMDRINGIRDRHGLLVIEDAAHALGAEWRGKQIGRHGNLTAYSFYATKNITTGEGGALATDDPQVADRVERLALHGLSVGAWQRFSDSGFKHYEVEEPGFKFNMTDMQAALGIHQLPQLDAWIDRRAELWTRYDELLSDLPLELPLGPAPNTRHARHLYQIVLSDEAPVTRDELLEHLVRCRIGAGVHYTAVHLHPYYRDRYELKADDFPVASRISQRTLSIPLAPAMSDDDQLDVVSAIRSGLRGP
jgi:dTDP-4-amino-4,6-dideoxygalactose transaminase